MTFLLPAAGTVCAQELAANVVELTYPVVELVYRVESVEGKVTKLAIKETATETRIEVPADILFDFDKADIRPAAAEALQQVSQILRERARGKVRIEGHTDAKGTAAYNKTLSEHRADSVRRWLVEHEGLDKAKLTIQGHAATDPVAANTKPDGSDDPDGRQKNRRVEIVIGKQ